MYFSDVWPWLGGRSIGTYLQHQHLPPPGTRLNHNILFNPRGIKKEKPSTSEMDGGRLQRGSESFGLKLLVPAERALITPHTSGAYGGDNWRHSVFIPRDGSRTRSCGSKLFL